MRKVKCSETRCYWRGNEDEMLSAPNPFDSTETISGCPGCKEINTIVYVCDEPKCWAKATCGTPTKNGYRSTCGKHKP